MTAIIPTYKLLYFTSEKKKISLDFNSSTDPYFLPVTDQVTTPTRTALRQDIIASKFTGKLRLRRAHSLHRSLA